MTSRKQNLPVRVTFLKSGQGRIMALSLTQMRRKTMNTDDMSKDELDLWSDINNPNNDADMDDWADAHNPNNDDYLGE